MKYAYQRHKFKNHELFLLVHFVISIIRHFFPFYSSCIILFVSKNTYLVTIFFCFRYISYLPLAHIYERVNQIGLVYYGAAVGFYQGVLHCFHL
jgi:hypothetical protein